MTQVQRTLVRYKDRAYYYTIDTVGNHWELALKGFMFVCAWVIVLVVMTAYLLFLPFTLPFFIVGGLTR